MIACTFAVLTALGKSRVCITVWAVVLLLAASKNACSAQSSTAFTYQGYLQDNSTNANGVYTNIFTLYDSVTNGNLIAGPIIVLTMPTNGAFTTLLDFGVPAVTTNGTPAWLDVQIDGEELTPRQLIAPVPLAANVATNSNATVGGENNLRIIRGAINDDGSIAFGSGFTCTLVTNGYYGYYQITFSTPFSAPPVITSLYFAGGDSSYYDDPGALFQRTKYGFVWASEETNFDPTSPDHVGWFDFELDGGGIAIYHTHLTDFIAIGPQ